jgi:hypothetical protein
MDCPFSVGDEVVCVDNELPIGAEATSGEYYPALGETFTIKHIRLLPRDTACSGLVVVDLVERPCPSDTPEERYGYPHYWFRRVEKPKRETSIEVFRKIDRDVFGRVPA